MISQLYTRLGMSYILRWFNATRYFLSQSHLWLFPRQICLRTIFMHKMSVLFQHCRYKIWDGSDFTQLNFTQLVLRRGTLHKFIQKTKYFEQNTVKSDTHYEFCWILHGLILHRNSFITFEIQFSFLHRDSDWLLPNSRRLNSTRWNFTQKNNWRFCLTQQCSHGLSVSFQPSVGLKYAIVAILHN